MIQCEPPERARDYSDAQHLSLRPTQSTAQCQCMRLAVCSAIYNFTHKIFLREARGDEGSTFKRESEVESCS